MLTVLECTAENCNYNKSQCCCKQNIDVKGGSTTKAMILVVAILLRNVKGLRQIRAVVVHQIEALKLVVMLQLVRIMTKRNALQITWALLE